MKPSIYRRIRRFAKQKPVTQKKENKQQQNFFAAAVSDGFFHAAPVVQRKCEHCEEEDKKLNRVADKKEDEKLQRKEAADSSTSNGTSSYIQTLNGKGSALPKAEQQFFSARMGYDFSHVRVHTGNEAAASAKEVHAKAYTIGNNIVFNEREYNAGSTEGKTLLAHELTHVVQQNENKIQRQTEEAAHEENEELGSVQFTGEGMYTENTTHYANCNNVSVRGRTSANYSNSFSSDGTQQRARRCSGCSAENCVTSSGTVTSNFSANPSVFLPSPQPGLNDCEHTAVQNFIDTTLAAHEQQHVDAFNTYVGTVTTPYTFTGCLTNLQAHIQAVHDRVERARRSASDAASAALDANGANQFTVTCNCP
jgi:Domain of unknown function (DUF4157)